MRNIIIRGAALAALFAPAPALAEPDYAAAIRADYQRSLGPMFDWFHRNPELSFKETATAARMAKELRAIPGIEVTEKVGGTGVVGVIRNGAGPTVLVRADMDGLPVEEKSGLPNASKARQVDIDGVEKPVMHACGHDTHITALVATARQLIATKDRWKGTVVFVVQPAEERVGGAKAMIEDGLYTRFPKPDYALAWHVAASLPSGKVSASETIQYASADSVDIIVHGVGAHGASPHAGRDPIYIGAQIVTALQGLVGREIDPIKPALITVGSFHSGSKHNIISDRAELLLTVRANDEETRAISAQGDSAGRARHRPRQRRCPKTSCRSSPTPKARRSPTTIPRSPGGSTRRSPMRSGPTNVVPFVQQGHGRRGLRLLRRARDTA